MLGQGKSLANESLSEDASLPEKWTVEEFQCGFMYQHNKPLSNELESSDSHLYSGIYLCCCTATSQASSYTYHLQCWWHTHPMHLCIYFAVFSLYCSSHLPIATWDEEWGTLSTRNAVIEAGGRISIEEGVRGREICIQLDEWCRYVPRTSGRDQYLCYVYNIYYMNLTSIQEVQG